MVKEIIFFSFGSSLNASTWSNIPYMFTRALVDRGIKVDRVDLSQQFGYKLFRVIWGGVLGGS